MYFTNITAAIALAILNVPVLGLSYILIQHAPAALAILSMLVSAGLMFLTVLIALND